MKGHEYDVEGQPAGISQRAEILIVLWQRESGGSYFPLDRAARAPPFWTRCTKHVWALRAGVIMELSSRTMAEKQEARTR